MHKNLNSIFDTESTNIYSIESIDSKKIYNYKNRVLACFQTRPQKYLQWCMHHNPHNNNNINGFACIDSIPFVAVVCSPFILSFDVVNSMANN